MELAEEAPAREPIAISHGGRSASQAEDDRGPLQLVNVAPANASGASVADFDGSLLYRIYDDFGLAGYKAFYQALAAEPAAELAYWRLTGGNPAGEIEARGGTDPDEVRRLVAEAVDGLRALVARFDDPSTPYLATPRPERAPRYSDYVHLARLKEWSLATDVGG